MNRIGMVAAGVCLAVAACVASLAALAQPAAGEESAVRGVVAEYVAARERGDSAAVGAVFTEHADQLTSSGEWRRGRAELVRGTLASSQSNRGSRTITIKSVRFPAVAVAIADGEYVIGAPGAGARNMWTSFVMVRSGGRWRIDAIRNMLPAAAAQ